MKKAILLRNKNLWEQCCFKYFLQLMNSHWREGIINSNKSHNTKKMNHIFLRISHRIRTQQDNSIKIIRLECHKISKISDQETCLRTYLNKTNLNTSLILILTINNHQKPSDTSTNLSYHQHTKIQWCINLMICQELMMVICQDLRMRVTQEDKMLLIRHYLLIIIIIMTILIHGLRILKC